LIEAHAWSAEKTPAPTIAAMTPSHVLPVSSAAVVPANAATSINPSIAMLTTPDRSQMEAPTAASAMGVANLTAEANSSGVKI
jgi:hypothetical protein